MKSTRRLNSSKFVFSSLSTVLLLLCIQGSAFGQAGNLGPGPNGGNTDLVPAPQTVYNRTLKLKDPGIYVKLKDWYCTSKSFREIFKNLIDKLVGDVTRQGGGPSPANMLDFNSFVPLVKEEKKNRETRGHPEFFNPLPGHFQQSIHKTCYTKAELDKIEKFSKQFNNYLEEEGYYKGQPNDPEGTALLNYRKSLYGVQ